jgi:hypothetical protein
MEQNLSDPSIQLEFTEDATGFARSTDILSNTTNSSFLSQSPQCNYIPFESQQSLADISLVQPFIPRRTGNIRPMNDNTNYNNRSSNLQFQQQVNQLYHSQQSVPGPSMQRTSVAANIPLLYPFDTTECNSMSSCVYQEPTYVDQFYQQQQGLPEQTKEQTIIPIARSPWDITDSSAMYQHHNLDHRNGSRLHQEQPNFPRPRSSLPPSTCDISNTAHRARLSNDTNTGQTVFSRFDLPDADTNKTSPPTPVHVTLDRSEHQKIKITPSQVRHLPCLR